MDSKQKVQKDIAELIKIVQYKRQHPAIPVTSLEAFKKALEEASKLLDQKV